MKKLLIIPLLFISLITQGQTIENAGFEDWETIGTNDEPVNWSSLKTGLPATLAGFAPVVMTQSTDARTGTYSVKLENIYVVIASVTANGLITNGRVHADMDPSKGYIQTEVSDAQYNTSCTFRPDSLVGYFKYTPSGGDILNVEVLLHTGTAKLPDSDSTNFIGYGMYASTNSTFSNWTRFSVPIYYSSPANPEYVLIILNSGNKTNPVEGSIALFDDISLVGTTVGISMPLFGNQINMYGSYRQINIDTREAEQNTLYNLNVYDILGKLVHKQSLVSGNSYQIENLHRGLYICNLIDNRGNVITQKVAVQ